MKKYSKWVVMVIFLILFSIFAYKIVMNKSIYIDNIVYDSWFDRVMIPIGIDPNGYHHAICIGFSDTQSLNSATIDDSDFNEDNVQYFNLKGEPIDINSDNNKIIIKTDGKKSVKFFK